MASSQIGGGLVVLLQRRGFGFESVRFRFVHALGGLDPQVLDFHLRASGRAGFALDAVRGDLLRFAVGAGAGERRFRFLGCRALARLGLREHVHAGDFRFVLLLHRTHIGLGLGLHAIDDLLTLGVGHDSHRLHLVLGALALRGHLQALDFRQLQLAVLGGECDLAVALFFLARQKALDVRFLALRFLGNQGDLALALLELDVALFLHLRAFELGGLGNQRNLAVAFFLLA